ncbi:helix-turn-helix domain-containing protein [Halorhabdus amylolytica]|uniref:helix-turn-helix domain-containing protein n=1 Tax=Halorhabdus amylolytica TaxID=2559573 RepID=UPI0010AACBD3|nr:helix-turn-helix domain-containing protein [Halorhabdus amylolytica]
MPAAIDDETRSEIVFRAAQGYTRSEIAKTVGISRTTVRKYLEKTIEVTEDSDRPRETLCAIIQNDYDWDRTEGKTDLDIDGVDFMSM